MRNRSGFALPMVLLLLVVASIVAVVGAAMASNHLRGSMNLESSVRALQAAESGAAFVVNGFSLRELEWLENGERSAAEIAALHPQIHSTRPESPNHGPSRWWVESMEFDGNDVTIRVRGEGPVEGSLRTIEVIYRRGSASALRPFGSAVVGCNGINLAGSGRIDSYDSRLGPYNQATANSNADVSTINGDLTLPGNTLVRGGIHVGGNLTMSGSATVEGSMQATGNVNFQGNPTCPATTVEAGGNITTPGSWWCPSADLAPGSDVPPVGGVCDPLDVNEFVDGQLEDARPPAGSYQSGNYSGWNPNPINFTSNPAFSPSFSTGSTTNVIFDSETVDEVFVNGNFSGAGSSIIRIKAPTTPGKIGQVRLFIDGDMNLSGAAQLIIEPGAALEVYVTGRVNLGGGLVNQNTSPTLTFENNGESVTIPTFAIYSSFAGTNGVQIGGNTQIFASVYAPRTSVTVAGSGGLYGAVRGGTVSVTGAGGIHYDEALADAGAGSSEDEELSRVTRWIEIH